MEPTLNFHILHILSFKGSPQWKSEANISMSELLPLEGSHFLLNSKLTFLELFEIFQGYVQ